MAVDYTWHDEAEQYISGLAKLGELVEQMRDDWKEQKLPGAGGDVIGRGGTDLEAAIAAIKQACSSLTEYQIKIELRLGIGAGT